MAGILCVVFIHFVQIFTNCPYRWLNESIDDDPFGMNVAKGNDVTLRYDSEIVMGAHRLR